MYFKFECPGCSKSLKVRDDQGGRRFRCPYCKATVTVPMHSGINLAVGEVVRQDASKPESTNDSNQGAFPGIKVGASAQTQVPQLSNVVSSKATSSPQVQGHAPIQSSDGSNVSLVTSGLIGLVCAIALFAMLFPLKLANVRLGTMFWNSFGINFPTTLLMFWSFAILLLKSRQLAKQKSAMLMDLLPSEISQEITLSSLDKFVAHMHNLPAVARQSILVNRVLRGIEHFRVRKSAAETVTMMESQSAIDASNVAGSYTIVKVFIWAMPILGFIGTVMGVSSAVSGLSATLENAADVSAVTTSMKSVFGGLGTAFDTTLLALIMSMIVKIPTSALQKSEDGLVTIVDEYCNENLLRRLNDGREGGAERGAGGQRVNVFQEAVEAAMGKHHAELENWLKRLDAIGTKLTTHVAKGWADINAKMHEQQAAQQTRFQQEYTSQATQLQQQLQEMNSVALGIQKALADLTGQAASMQGDVTNSMSGSAEALQTHFAGLERGLNGLNQVLESLSDKQVVVQQVQPERRGWFGGRKGNGRR